MTKPTTFDEAAQQAAQEVVALIIKKQHDYGQANILNSPFGVEQGLVTRLWDKLARAANLLTTGSTPNNESIEDTWNDIVGYGLLGKMTRNGTFELPLKDKQDESV